MEPNHYNSLFFLAMRLATNKINRQPEAIAYFTGCIALRPNDFQAYGNRAFCYFNLGQLDDSIADCRQALRLRPDHALSHYNLGHALWHKGRPDEAIAACREAVRLAPDYAEAYNNLAWFLANCPDPKVCDPAQAVELARKAVELAPQNSGNRNTLGVAHYRAGDWKASVVAMEKSMELGNGGDAFDWYFVAMAHWRLGHNDRGPRMVRQGRGLEREEPAPARE